MMVTDNDPALAIRFKTALINDFDTRLENFHMLCLKLSTSLDPFFKNLRCVPKCKRENIWLELHNLVINADSDGQLFFRSSELPLKKIRFCDFLRSTQSNANLTICRYRSEPEIDDNECSLQCGRDVKVLIRLCPKFLENIFALLRQVLLAKDFFLIQET
ncbi:hypothetical protein RF11_10195 [Thelohanellus kitauei]|uniref:Uncharacterized protein n=1 Tax=Thelohanellus kitauei TaxID=669202 RepID=A0A0C2IWA0_THEKT|nr:hypothetical protein RF11_10195 [Thelohanellus kitauei]